MDLLEFKNGLSALDYPDYWKPVLLHQILLDNGIQSDTAVVNGDDNWTYAKLRECAYEYAFAIYNAGVPKSARLVLDSRPCPQAISLICACSMLGVSFTAINPDNPPERKKEIVKTLAPAVVIDSTGSNSYDVPVFGSIQQDKLVLKGLAGNRGILTRVLDTDVAYIVFTSGSTGTPKGIMMSQRAVVAFFKGLNERVKLGKGSVVATTSPLQFDFSLLDMGMTLGQGMKLVQTPGALLHHPVRYLDYLRKHETTQSNGVPSIMRMILVSAREGLNALGSLNTMFFGGEALTYNDVTLLRQVKPQMRIINIFGHTESVACSTFEVPFSHHSDRGIVPIGKPISGMGMFVLDDNKARVKDGEIGELYIEGSALFNGYYKDEDRNRETIVPHPKYPEYCQRVFKTGDLVRRDENGLFHFHGRRDSQIKIRGNRVELVEIEKCLLNINGIESVAVTALNGDDGEYNKIVAFLKRSNDSSCTVNLIQNRCAQKLPKYMIPSDIVFVSHIPCTANGKTDIRKLVERYLKNLEVING